WVKPLNSLASCNRSPENTSTCDAIGRIPFDLPLVCFLLEWFGNHRWQVDRRSLHCRKVCAALSIERDSIGPDYFLVFVDFDEAYGNCLTCRVNLHSQS